MSLHGLESELPCRVLVVVGSPCRLAEVHAVLGLVMPDGLVEVADTVVEALLRLTRKPAQLLLLDLAVDDAFAPVVVRHLARVARQTPQPCTLPLRRGPFQKNAALPALTALLRQRPAAPARPHPVQDRRPAG